MANQTRALVDHVRRHGRDLRIHVLEVGPRFAITPSELFRALTRSDCQLLVVSDPRLCGGLGLRGLFRAWRIGRRLSKESISCLVVSWDTYDPLHALITRALTRSGGRILLLGSLPSTASSMHIDARAVGPAPEAVLGEAVVQDPGCMAEWSGREYDVFISPMGRGARDRLTAAIRDSCDVAGLTICQPVRPQEYADYLEMLGRCRCVVVSNDVHPDYLRFRTWRSTTQGSHFVGRNFEALAAGSLLITQDCPEARAVLQRLDGITLWDRPEDVGGIVSELLGDPYKAQAMREEAHATLRSLTARQETLRRLLSSAS